MKKWRSCAKWEEGHFYYCDDTTTDEHETKEQAEAVCKRLEKEGLGGERCHFPIKTWVERINE